MLYLETGSHDPTWNLAFEEYCLTELTQFPRILLLWQNDRSIIIGRYQNAQNEVHADMVRERDIRVVRRSTGGGAVYHDLGNLNYSFIFPQESDVMNLKKFSEPIIGALRELGVLAEVQGRNDLTIDGKKISGTAQRLHHGRILHHGTLLFDSDLTVLSQVLRVDDVKYFSKGAASVRSRVANIAEFLPQQCTLMDFWSRLLEALRQYGLEHYEMSPTDLERIGRMQMEKYRSWDWIHAKAPQFQYHAAQRFAGGKIEILFDVTHGRISRCQIQGDFLGLVPIDTLESALQGSPYRRDAVLQTLLSLPLPLYLGKITAEELLECMFQDEI